MKIHECPHASREDLPGPYVEAANVTERRSSHRPGRGEFHHEWCPSGQRLEGSQAFILKDVEVAVGDGYAAGLFQVGPAQFEDLRQEKLE
ncbi:MAG: hypothetical protein V2A77_08120 [Pseudomonadota bacterium]